MRGASETAIGIDFGGTKIEVALARADGTVLEHERLETRAELGPRQALERAAAAVARLELRAREVHASTVTGYAAVAPGIVQSDRILLTPNLPGWENLALARELQQLLDLDDDHAPAVANDVRAGALAELRFGALRGAEPGLYISLGTGIAAAVTLADRVLIGANQAAGEIAYMDPGPISVRAGEGGRRFGSAPLEELVGGKAIGERASLVLGEKVSAADVFARAASGDDAVAAAFVRETLDVLARSIANMAVLIDPELVVLGGGMMASADLILPALREHLAAAVPFPPRIAPARFTRDASLHGAIALALDHGAPAAADTTRLRPLDLVRIPAVPARTAPNPVEESQCMTGGATP